MKKFLASLFGKSSTAGNASAAGLGSDSDPIRQMLFASQSLAEILAQVRPDGTPGPFQSMAEAAELAAQGRRPEAIQRLHAILTEEDLETRVHLWVWSALRELGEEPDDRIGTEVLGVIFEVPSGGAYDTLAAYADGSARYLNYSGAAIFWEQPDTVIKSRCQAAIDSSLAASAAARPRTTLALPRKGAQLTLLTRSGNYAIPNPQGEVMDAGVKLMMELIERSEKQRQLPSG